MTEYSTETFYAAQGGVTVGCLVLSEQRALRRAVRQRAARVRGARLRRFRVSFLRLHRDAPGRDAALRTRVRRDLVQVLHELQGRGRPLHGPRRHRRRLTFTTCWSSRSSRQADDRVPHREHRDGRPHSPALPVRGQGLVPRVLPVEAAITEAENLVRAAYLAEKTGRADLHSARQLGHGHRGCAPVARPLRRGLAGDLPALPHASHGHGSRQRLQGEPAAAHAGRYDALWAALADGTIDVLASDHVPRKRATKEKPIWQASQGFPGTATILPVILSEGYHKGRIGLQRIAQVFSSTPARCSTWARKGRRRGGLRRRPDAGRSRARARRGSGGARVVFRLQPVRRLEAQGLAGAHHRARRHGHADHRVVGAEGHGRYLERQLRSSA